MQVRRDSARADDTRAQRARTSSELVIILITPAQECIDMRRARKGMSCVKRNQHVRKNWLIASCTPIRNNEASFICASCLNSKALAHIHTQVCTQKCVLRYEISPTRRFAEAMRPATFAEDASVQEYTHKHAMHKLSEQSGAISAYLGDTRAPTR